MKKYVLVFGLIILASTSCNQGNGIMLRIQNASQYDFESVYVDAAGGIGEYPELKAGSTSEYKTYDYCYSYAYIKVIIAGEEFILQPIDYVGERKYRKGKYTYKLNVYDYANKQLSIDFVKD